MEVLKAYKTHRSDGPQIEKFFIETKDTFGENPIKCGYRSGRNLNNASPISFPEATQVQQKEELASSNAD